MIKCAVMMDMPEGKLPGFYAQIVKAIAGKITLFDRDKETLIVENEEEVQQLLQVLDHYKVATDVVPLLLLPENARITPAFSDYGFESRLENRYLLLESIVRFKLVGGEQRQAVAQLEEHLLAAYTDPADNRTVYVADRELTELMEGIGKRYGCTVEILE